MLVDAITGGNPNLQSDRRNVIKFGGNWQPFAKTDLRLRADFVHQTIERPISNITVTRAIEAAFPERFVRDTSGQLVRVDLRPVNFDSARRDPLRVGLRLLEAAEIAASVAGGDRPAPRAIRLRRRAAAQPGARRHAWRRSAPAQPPQAARRPRRPRWRRRRRQALAVSAAAVAAAAAASSAAASQSRPAAILADRHHHLRRQSHDHARRAGARLSPRRRGGLARRHAPPPGPGAGRLVNNGLGARIGANWRSATTVNTLTGDDLHFSPVGTFDLRLFANPGDIPEVAVKHPWLRGTQFRLEVNNVFNAVRTSTTRAGDVPLNYQPDLLDPLGRTIMISFRKLFLPSPATIPPAVPAGPPAGAPAPPTLDFAFAEYCALARGNDACSARPGHAKPAWRRRRPPRRGGRGVRSACAACTVSSGSKCRPSSRRPCSRGPSARRPTWSRRKCIRSRTAAGNRSRSGQSSPPASAAPI